MRGGDRRILPRRAGGMVVASCLLGMIVPSPVAAQSAPEPDAREVLRRGSLEVGVVTGYSLGIDLGNAPSTNRNAVFVFPRVGLVVTDEFKADYLTGNLEVYLEPLYAHYVNPFSANAAGGGLVLKYNLTFFGRWVPFWEAGAGMLWQNLAPRIPEQSIQLSFELETGPGVHYLFTKSLAATAGVRLHHISNAYLGERNTGLNAIIPYVGISVFLPR